MAVNNPGFNKMLYANVINLTPGTLTVDITKDGYIIHALNENFAKGLDGFILEKLVLKLEEKK
ncbi:Na+/H+ antiporter subunit E [Amphibacillus indicireducens]|uniref:Uncharacterized protein n=1 Tax=Amphibacillus indicireducens TaxID=1076330 RepID=A0ABP7V747_9BACI